MSLLALRRPLNGPATPTSSGVDGPEVAATVVRGLREIVGEALARDGHAGDAGRSPALTPLLEQARSLAAFDPRGLAEPAARAFWLNVYNGLVRHGVIALRVRERVLEAPFFFARVAWRIGPYVLSLNDVEHGILRGNRRHPAAPWRPFGRRSATSELVLRLDPRIHFALNCGARSCPPVGVYSADRLEIELDLATRSFLVSGIAVDRTAHTITVSKILRWYGGDFPGGPLPWALPYLDEQAREQLRSALFGGFRVRSSAYDWRVA